MLVRRPVSLAVVALLVAALPACSSGSGGSGAPSELQFHGQADALPGFKGDTGLQPPASPVQVQLLLSAQGTLTADAVATSAGSTMVGKPGSGQFALDVHLKFQANLSESVSGLPPYNGPVPGLDSLDIEFKAQVGFDPFLIGGKATVTAQVPETKLPGVPLPSGLGTLIITVSGDS